MGIIERFKDFQSDNSRSIDIKYKIEDETMWVQSHLADDYHNIYLYWKINIPTHTITGIEAGMENIPFDDCAKALKIVDSFKGLEIGVGVKKKFRASFSKGDGCTHITELALATFDFIMARLYGPASQRLPEEEQGRRRHQIATFLCDNDSCTIFNRKNTPNFDKEGRYKGKYYNY